MRRYTLTDFVVLFVDDYVESVGYRMRCAGDSSKPCADHRDPALGVLGVIWAGWWGLICVLARNERAYNQSGTYRLE